MEKKKGLTGSQLKIIAMVSMLIDHLAATVLLQLLQAPYDPSAGNVLADWVWNHWQLLAKVYDTMRQIGRFAFPLYCFLLVEGFTHTRSVPKYALRLGIFALVSEFPFDIALNGSFFDPGYNNVFFTLLTGLVCLWALDSLRTLGKEGKLPGFLGVFLSCAAVLAGFLLAEHVLVCDYAGKGVLAIVAIWLLRRWPVPAFIAGTLVLSYGNSSELYALFMVLPIALYNGQRGRAMKLGPYLFYPLHLMLLWLITMLLLKQPVFLF